jgi:hypothetical protein
LVLLQTAFGLAVLALCGFAPGFYFVRRLRWSGLEKLCGAIGLSLIFLWLAAWGVYLVTHTIGAPAGWLIVSICLAAAVASRHDAVSLFRGVRVRRAVAGFAFLLVWTVVLLSIIRNYSGAGWRGDWLEHFQRSLFFLHALPRNTEIFGGYQLPARPPAMNVLGAFAMALAGDRFEVFQAAFAFLNLLLFLPCAMALPMLARPRRPGVLPLAAIFAASPVVMQNATYTWTKSLAAFFVILGILLYLEGWRKRDSRRTTAAFLALAMGALVHYSAGPYIAFLGLHYVLRRPVLREARAIAGLCAGLLATWFGWSIATYGAGSTFASNTSVTTSQYYKGHNVEKIAGNLEDSTIPMVLRDASAADRYFPQRNPIGVLRDAGFVVYQQNLIFCMGALGGLAVVWLLVATLRRRFGREGERGFWIGLIAWSAAVGIAVVGERDPLGVAHLTLVPMAALGMTLLAARFRSSRVVAWVVVVGCIVDFFLGVFPHARIEHMENTRDFRMFPGLIFDGSRFRTAPGTRDSLTAAAWDNWMHKHEYALADEWGEVVDSAPASEASKDDARRKLAHMKAEDASLFGGWYERHNGEVKFLGDWFGDGDVLSAVLVLLFGGLMWKVVGAVPEARAQAIAVGAKADGVKGRRKKR